MLSTRYWDQSGKHKSDFGFIMQIAWVDQLELSTPGHGRKSKSSSELTEMVQAWIRVGLELD